jgi:hypothetical protein
MHRQTSAKLSNAVRLEIRVERRGEFEEEGEDMGGINWLERLCQFTAVETLHTSEEFALSIAHALEETPVETGTRYCWPLTHFFWKVVRPALSNLFAIL